MSKRYREPRFFGPAEGLGILKCAICGDPFTADHHRVGFPCPHAKGPLTVDRARRRDLRGETSNG